MTTEKKTNEKQPELPVKQTIKKSEIVDKVLLKVQELENLGQLRLPKDYSAENALKAAYLDLIELKDKNEKYALDVCTPSSIADALLKMVTEGLSVAKKQGNLIVYGNKLQWQRQYFGNVALAKRYGNVKNVHAQCIYEGDVFEYMLEPNTGKQKLVKHEQKFENIDDNKLKGAYAIVIDNNDDTELVVMNMVQIRKAWNMGYGKGNTKAHNEFSGEMSKKSVINRACKLYINTSDDAALFDEEERVLNESSREEVRKRQNSENLDFDEIEDAEASVVTSEEKQPEAPKEQQPEKPKHQEAPKQQNTSQNADLFAGKKNEPEF